MPDGQQYSILCAGDARFFREAGVSLCETVELILDNEGWSKAGLLDASLFPINKAPHADASTSMALGVLFFAGSWAVSKIFDEVYTLKLQPKLRQWLLKADEIVVFGHKKQKRIFSVSMYYEELGIVVMVALTGASYAALADELNAVRKLQLEGLEWARQHPGSGPVYLYVIDNGSANNRPLEFSSVDQAGKTLGR